MNQYSQLSNPQTLSSVYGFDSNATIHLYDGWNCIADYTRSVGVSPTLQKTYLWGMDLSGTLQAAGGVGGLLLLTDHSTLITHFPTNDGNGNISEYLTASGTIAAHFAYDPFGNTIVNTDSSNLFNYGFSTKPRDNETGLYYYGYRYYDPATGRWPSRDSIEEEGGINLYGFVRNDGVNKVDILGNSPLGMSGLLGVVVIETTEKLKECKGGCKNGKDLTQDCVGCCNGVAAAAQILLGAAAVAMEIECVTKFFANPAGHVACITVILHAQNSAANAITDAHNACTDKCIAAAPPLY